MRIIAAIMACAMLIGLPTVAIRAALRDLRRREDDEVEEELMELEEQYRRAS